MILGSREELKFNDVQFKPQDATSFGLPSLHPFVNFYSTVRITFRRYF